MAKFSNAKVGDKVFSSIFGWGKIVGIYNECICSVQVEFDNGDTVGYMFDGRRFGDDDKYPTLFWNEFHIPTDEEDKSPFDLVEFLKESVSSVEFFEGEDNYFVFYHSYLKKFYLRCDNFIKISNVNNLPVVYLDSGDFNAVVAKLNERNITPKQLKQAYKELGWM